MPAGVFSAAFVLSDEACAAGGTYGINNNGPGVSAQAHMRFTMEDLPAPIGPVLPDSHCRVSLSNQPFGPLCGGVSIFDVFTGVELHSSGATAAGTAGSDSPSRNGANNAPAACRFSRHVTATAAVPEPAGLALPGGGLPGPGPIRRRKA